MAARPVKVAFLADTKDLQQNLQRAETAMKGAADTAQSAGRSIDTSLERAAEGSDAVASASSQAAGGIGDIAGALEATGLISESTAKSMETASAAIMGATGAADLMNLTMAKFPGLAKVSIVFTKAWAFAQKALNVVMRLNPIGLIITGIVALILILPLLVKHWDTVKAKLSAVWKGIKKVFTATWNGIKGAAVAIWGAIKSRAMAVFNGVKSYFSTVLKVYKTIFVGAWRAISSVVRGAVNGVRRIIVTVWNAIKNVTRNTFAGVKNLVTNPLTAIVSFIKGVPGKITALGGRFLSAGRSIMLKIVEGIKGAAGFIGNIASGIWGAVKGMLNQAIGKINNALEFRVSLPLGKSITINPPDIPYLANGGIVNRATLAVIGEAGPEAVVPLNGRHGFGGNTYAITINAPVGSSPADIGREIVKYVDAFERAGGRRRTR